jgi:hypothetical protein
MMEAADFFGTVSWLRQIVAIFSCWRPTFELVAVHVGFMVGKEELTYFASRYFGLLLLVSLHH